MKIIQSDPPYFAFGRQEEFYFGKPLSFMSQPAIVFFIKPCTALIFTGQPLFIEAFCVFRDFFCILYIINNFYVSGVRGYF